MDNPSLVSRFDEFVARFSAVVLTDILCFSQVDCKVNSSGSGKAAPNQASAPVPVMQINSMSPPAWCTVGKHDAHSCDCARPSNSRSARTPLVVNSSAQAPFCLPSSSCNDSSGWFSTHKLAPASWNSWEGDRDEDIFEFGASSTHNYA